MQILLALSPNMNGLDSWSLMKEGCAEGVKRQDRMHGFVRIDEMVEALTNSEEWGNTPARLPELQTF